MDFIDIDDFIKKINQIGKKIAYEVEAVGSTIVSSNVKT